MPCQQPTKVYRPTTGGPVSFTRPINGQAGEDYQAFNIPCGTCILCREEQARQWAIRITHEAQLHDESSFVTLTYDETHKPTDGGLRYEDLQRFWKRARKEYGKMRYYAVGEYGDESQRAHYHACIFGHAFTDDRIVVTETPNLLWTSMRLTRCWGMGGVRIGALNFQTARYTASYVTKKLRSKQQYVKVDEETGELIPLQQPKAFMSRNLARTWWEDNYHGVIAHDRVVIGGRPQKPPKAYDRWLSEVNELAGEMVKEQRMKLMEVKDPEKNRARARNAHARVRRKTKSI